MTDKRTKILVILTVAVAGAFVLDKALGALWLEPQRKLNQDILKTKQEIDRSNEALRREPEVQRDWTKIKDRLNQPRQPDVHTHFLAHLGEVFDKAGVTFDVSEAQAQQQGDFKEYVYDTKFKLTWSQFVDLLVELHNSREFLKPLRLTIGSQYEKEERLDLELKLSTIEYSPSTAKPGAK
jgi:hypothetical protein